VGRHNVHNPASGRIMEKTGMTFSRGGTGVEGSAARQGDRSPMTAPLLLEGNIAT
jgi:hypothetical protein